MAVVQSGTVTAQAWDLTDASITVAHVVASGVTRLIVIVDSADGPAVTGITWNGTALTNVADIQSASSGTQYMYISHIRFSTSTRLS